jgi:hypothetical protein
VEFGVQVTGWDHDQPFRLASRKISEWETALTEEALDLIAWDVRGSSS